MPKPPPPRLAELTAEFFGGRVPERFTADTVREALAHDFEATVRAGCTADGGGLMINSSRAILYASRGEDFAAAARQAALATRAAINAYRPAANAV
jgi:hypothetical protein